MIGPETSDGLGVCLPGAMIMGANRAARAVESLMGCPVTGRATTVIGFLLRRCVCGRNRSMGKCAAR